MPELSATKRDYAGRVSRGTGLDPTVVQAWVAQESGWDGSKAGHNYLNIGPGRTYASVAAAAQAAVQLLHQDRYAPILAARGARAQLDAIVRSPWDEDRYHNTLGPDGQITSWLHQTYESIATLGGGTGQTGVGVTGVQFGLNPLSPETLAFNGLRALLGVTEQEEGVLIIALNVVFVLAGLALILAGVWRLTEKSPALRTIATKGLA